MKPDVRSQLLATISRLQRDHKASDLWQAGRLLMEVLQPLLMEDGYAVTQTPPRRDEGLDFLANRPPSAKYQGEILGISVQALPFRKACRSCRGPGSNWRRDAART